MMAYVTRYIFGTDKLRPNAFEVRGMNGSNTGVIHINDLAVLSHWIKLISDYIAGLTNHKGAVFNRGFGPADQISYMNWVAEGVLNSNQPWQNWKPKFFALRGSDVCIFDSPPVIKLLKLCKRSFYSHHKLYYFGRWMPVTGIAMYKFTRFTRQCSG
jgi:hypothetical protein